MVNFLPRLAIPSYKTIPYERQDDVVRQFTPQPLFNIAQPDLEKFLTEVAQSGGIGICNQRNWLDVESPDSLPMSTIKNKSSGQTYQIQSKCIIGCDGANSTLRDSLDIR